MKRYAQSIAAGAALTLAAALFASCADVQRSSVQAQTGAPVAAQVPVATVAYDPNLPRFVVAVEPFTSGASGVVSGGAGTPRAPQAAGGIGSVINGGLEGGRVQGGREGVVHPGDQIGQGISAQLMTALSNNPNISVVDRTAVIQRPDGSYSCRLNPGEVGPFILRGTVTEFNETADLSGKDRGGSLGLVGAGLGVAGAVTHHSALTWTGAGLAVANPTYQNSKVKRSGMVGMDMQLYDGRTSRLLRGYNSSGTFTTESATSGLSVFGIGGGNAEFAASALGQATRAAMNDALLKTSDALRVAPR